MTEQDDKWRAARREPSVRNGLLGIGDVRAMAAEDERKREGEEQ